MAHVALQEALPADWVDEVFQSHRQRQYRRQLLMSTVVELMMLVSLGLRPSLHAAARKKEHLPVSLAALYEKVNRTEPQVMRALVQGSAERLRPVMEAVGARSHSLPGWELRVLDGNHLPASDKRVAALRGHRAAALPGHTLVVYAPELGLVTDLVACEDAYESERVGALPLVASAQAGQVWIADRHFCTRTLLQGWEHAGAAFIVRELRTHPTLQEQGPWRASGECAGGRLEEQWIRLEQGGQSWRRIRLQLQVPTESGDTQLLLWSNLPEQISAVQIAQTYRQRWRIEGLFGRLESVLTSEIASLGQPRAALLGFACAVLAYNVLALLKHCVEQVHRPQSPDLDVSTYHLAVHVASDHAGLCIALPEEGWQGWQGAHQNLATYLCALAAYVPARSVATSKRGPKKEKPKEFLPASQASQHVSTARVLAQAKRDKGSTP